MTVLVGYHPDRGGRASLQLGTALARALGTTLVVAHVVRTPWRHPTDHGSGDEQRAGVAARIEQQVHAHLEEISADVEVRFRHLSERSVSRSLVALATELPAQVLVLGSSAAGQVGQIVVGSTADGLLHSAPLPVALAPRGFRGPRGVLRRVTVATTGEDEPSVVAARDLAGRLGADLRVMALAVRTRPVLTSPAGLDAEDPVLGAWTQHALTAIADLRGRGVLDDHDTTVVGVGVGWREALDAVDWAEGDLLVLGTPPAGPVARVFLGSHATKILRHAPVPVLVLPG